MQQAMHILKLPISELEPFIEEQVVSNPLLDIIPSGENFLVSSNKEGSNHLEKIEEEIFIDDQNLTILMQLDEDLHDHFSATEMPMKISLENEIFKNYLENSILAVPTLFENLHQQAADTFDQSFELEIADILIGYMDEDMDL
jgi:RNA polymerase sigma-54 factor